VILKQQPIIPGVIAALSRLFSVLQLHIAQDLGTGRVGGSDFCTPVEQSVRLVEIDRLGDIGRNHSVVLADFRNAIHLYRQQNWNTFALQVAGESDRRRCPPAMTEQDYPSTPFFFIGQETVMIPVEEMRDGPMGLSPMAIFEYLDINSIFVRAAKPSSELHFLMTQVIMADEPAYETDHDGVLRGACRHS